MSDDELKRVQAIADALSDSYQNGVNDGLEFGMTQRERLREENTRLREALKPFADEAEKYNRALFLGPDIDHWCYDGGRITFGQLRAAAAAIREGGKA